MSTASLRSAPITRYVLLPLPVIGPGCAPRMVNRATSVDVRSQRVKHHASASRHRRPTRNYSEAPARRESCGDTDRESRRARRAMSAPVTVARQCWPSRLRVLALHVDAVAILRGPPSRRDAAVRVDRVRRPRRRTTASVPRSGANVASAAAVGDDLAGIAADRTATRPSAAPAGRRTSTYSSVAGVRRREVRRLAFEREPARRHRGVAAVHAHRRIRA